MIDALARAAAALDEPRYAAAATKTAEFIRTRLLRPDGRLLHTWRHGKSKLDAYLDDYAALANGLISLYEATFDGEQLTEAARLLDIVIEHFADRKGGGFFYTADDHEELIARNKDATDASVPSASALAATALVRLGKLTGELKYVSAGESALRAAAGLMQQAPTSMGQMLIALDLYIGPTYEMAYAEPTDKTSSAEAVRDIRRRFFPNKVMASLSDSPELLRDLMAGKQPIDGQPTLYVCEAFTCQEPAVGVPAIGQKLDALTRRP